MYEEQYIYRLKDILDNGIVEKNERTGIMTYRIPSSIFNIDLQRELPILRSKKIAWKTALDEVFWIFQKQSNNVHDLNSKIWDNWADENGSIGKTYGYQVKTFTQDKISIYPNQVAYVLQRLGNNPSDRQCVIDMWNPRELFEMNLPPCVYSSVWSIINGKLNCMVVQRSADYPVGVPFDTLEYAMLTHLFARHLGVGVGKLTHVMADSHIYEDQVPGVLEQIRRYQSSDYPVIPTPKLVFKTDKTNFWDMTEDDIEIVDYEPMDAIKFNVAV